jgi:hypothetical protein
MIAAAPVAVALALGKILTYISYGKVTLRFNCAAFVFNHFVRHMYIFFARLFIRRGWIGKYTKHSSLFCLSRVPRCFNKPRASDALAFHVMVVGGGCF